MEKVSQNSKDKLIELIKDKHIYSITFGYTVGKCESIPDDNNLSNSFEVYKTSSMSSLKEASKDWKYIDNIDRILFDALYDVFYDKETCESDIKLNQILVDFINEHELTEIECYCTSYTASISYEPLYLMDFETINIDDYKNETLKVLLSVGKRKGK